MNNHLSTERIADFNNMIKVINHLSSLNLTPVYSHIFAMILAKMYMNRDSEYKPESGPNLNKVKELCVIVLTPTNEYCGLLDIKYITLLTSKYVEYFRKLLYHEAVPNEYDVIDNQDMFILSFLGLGEVISKEDLKALYNSKLELGKYYSIILRGIKTFNERYKVVLC